MGAFPLQLCLLVENFLDQIKINLIRESNFIVYTDAT